MEILFVCKNPYNFFLSFSTEEMLQNFLIHKCMCAWKLAICLVVGLEDCPAKIMPVRDLDNPYWLK